MKVLCDVVETITWFDHIGTPRPVRFRYRRNVLKVDHIQEIRGEKLAKDKNIPVSKHYKRGSKIIRAQVRTGQLPVVSMEDVTTSQKKL